MSEDDAFLLTAWRAKMSTASIAGMLGWPESRVANRLGQLRSAAAAPPPAPPPPPPPPPPPAAPPPFAPQLLRWVRWFLAAGWSVGEVAWLFDEAVEDVARAIP